MNTATEIINQLGGSKFVVMTGSKNFLFAERSETVKNEWLRMDLTRNQSGANRLKITLNDDDAYTMYFYKQTIKLKPVVDCIISKEQTFKGVYCDMLQVTFTQVTGLYTTLGTFGK